MTPPTQPEQEALAPETSEVPSPQSPPAQPASEYPPAATPAERAPKKKGGWGKWVALGCGCVFVIVAAIVAILAAIAIPTFMKAKGALQDYAVVSKLRNAGAAAAVYVTEHDGSFEGMNAAALAASDSSVRFENGTPGPDMQTGVIYVDKLAAGKTKYSVSIKSESGTVFRMTYDNGAAKIEKCGP